MKSNQTPSASGTTRKPVDLGMLLERAQGDLGYDRGANLVLNDASDYFGSVLPEADPRAWNHLIIYCPTSLLIRALCWRVVKRFTYRWRN